MYCFCVYLISLWALLVFGQCYNLTPARSQTIKMSASNSMYLILWENLDYYHLENYAHGPGIGQPGPGWWRVGRNKVLITFGMLQGAPVSRTTTCRFRKIQWRVLRRACSPGACSLETALVPAPTCALLLCAPAARRGFLLGSFLSESIRRRRTPPSPSAGSTRGFSLVCVPPRTQGPHL